MPASVWKGFIAFSFVSIPVKLKQQEIKLTEQLIASMMQPFKPAQYHDEFQDRLRKLVEAKRRGQTVEVAGEQG